MRVIPPILLTDAMLTSSTVIEPSGTETAWLAATSYTVGQQAYRATTHNIYTNLIAGVDAGLPENTPLRWLDSGRTNKWRMFNPLKNTSTSGTSPMIVVITPNTVISSMAIMGVIADKIQIDITVDGINIYSKNLTTLDRKSASWTDFYFSDLSNNKNFILYNLPTIYGAIITVTFTRVAGNCSCANLIIGKDIYIGDAEYSAESDALNFSKIDRNLYGDAELIPRRNVPTTNQTLNIKKNLVNKLYDVRDSLNAIPAVWSGIDDYSDGYFKSLLILGIYKQFSVNLSFPNDAKVTLKLEEI